MNKPNLHTMAWRNLWRHRRRTILTLASIAFGGFLAVLMTALQDRSFADFIDTAARLGAGHITIQHPEYLDKPTLSRTVTATGEKRATAEAETEVSRAVERATGQTMLSTARDAYGAFFLAFDPQVETEETMEFTKGMQQGTMFQTADDQGIILGTVLAENLQVELGDKIVFTMSDRHGEIVTAMERVRGIVSTGAASTDAAIALLTIGTVRDVVGFGPEETTQVAVFLDDGRQSLALAERLGEKISEDAAVLTWDQIQPEIKAFVAMKVGGGRFMELVIALLITAGIFNTIFMSVLERTREFGIMMAIGYSARQLFRLVMWESSYLAGLGLALAFAVTIGPYLYLSNIGIDLSEAYAQQGASMDIGGVGMSPILRIGIFPENALVIAIAIVAATLVAGLYPAWRAGRVNPVDAIKLV